MLTRERVVDLLREQSAYLASEFGIRKMGLFGSFAKGHPGEQSDIDVVVEFERPIGLRFIELVEYLETLLICPLPDQRRLTCDPDFSF